MAKLLLEFLPRLTKAIRGEARMAAKRIYTMAQASDVCRFDLTPAVGRQVVALSNVGLRQLAWRLGDLPSGALQGKWWIEHDENRPTVDENGAPEILKRRGSYVEIHNGVVKVWSVLDVHAADGGPKVLLTEAAGMIKEDEIVITPVVDAAATRPAGQPKGSDTLALLKLMGAIFLDQHVVTAALAALALVLGVPEMLSLTSSRGWQRLTIKPRWATVDPKTGLPLVRDSVSGWFTDELAMACLDQSVLLTSGWQCASSLESHRSFNRELRAQRTFIETAERLMISDDVVASAVDLSRRLGGVPVEPRPPTLLPFPAMLLEFSVDDPALIGVSRPGRHVMCLQSKGAEEAGVAATSPCSDAFALLFAEDAEPYRPTDAMDVHVGSDALPFLSNRSYRDGGILDADRFATFVFAVLQIIAMPRSITMTAIHRSPQSSGAETLAKRPAAFETWREVKFVVDGEGVSILGVGNRPRSGIGVGRARHRVRAFFRIRRGRIEAVRAHFRGDAARGSVRKVYRAIRSSRK